MASTPKWGGALRTLDTATVVSIFRENPGQHVRETQAEESGTRKLRTNSHTKQVDWRESVTEQEKEVIPVEDSPRGSRLVGLTCGVKPRRVKRVIMGCQRPNRERKVFTGGSFWL